MKSFSFRLILLVALALLAFGCNGKRVAIVNTELVYQESAASSKGSEYLRAVSTEMQKAYTEASAKVENAKTKQEKEAAQAELQTAIAEMQQRLGAEQQLVVTTLTNAYREAMEACRIKGKFDVILPAEAALAHDPQVDLTAQVLAEMDSMPIEFTAETPAEQPADAAPAQ